MKISFIFYIEIILFFYIVNQDKITHSKKLELNGIYRIDSLLNYYSLTDENYKLQFSDKSKKKNQNIFELFKSKIIYFILRKKVEEKYL